MMGYGFLLDEPEVRMGIATMPKDLRQLFWILNGFGCMKSCTAFVAAGMMSFITGWRVALRFRAA